MKGKKEPESGVSSSPKEDESFPKRLANIIGGRSVRSFALESGVSQTVIRKYLSGESEPTRPALVSMARAGGASVGWLVAGEESVQETAQPSQSHPVRRDALKMAIQLAQEALDGRTLVPADYAELVDLIYEALVNGLPSAQVLAFARPAARGIGLKGGTDATAMDRSGEGAAGARE